MAENRRVVSDKWYLGETLGKGGYGFVKCGYHIKTGKPFALKFMRKADESERWARDQAQQVATEINALKAVDNKNVLKLFAYNLKCEYPDKSGKNFDTVLLVLELAPGGELFDILYYTSKLEPVLARTYMDQLVNGLSAIHAANICHRDLKPQNLLLNKKFQLKITDFGLAKIFEEKAAGKNQVNVMKTAYVGTKGYQAPELLLKRKYTNKCDVFSVGVIMFILMTGYPPLEQADANDNWYRKICQKKYSAFWNKHRGCGLEGTDNGMAEARDLIEKLLCYQPTDRLKSDDIKKHPWLSGPGMEKLSSDDLFRTMKTKHANAVAKKKNDKTKQEQLQTSIVMRDIAGGVIPTIPVAGHNLPPATTFAIKPEEGDFNEAGEETDELKNRLSYLLDVFAEIINKKGGRSTRASREEGPEFWSITGQCMTADNQFMTISCQIVQKEIKNKKRQLLSFKVGSKNLTARLNMVEIIKNQYTINWDDSVTMDDLESAVHYNDEEDDYDYAADFEALHTQVNDFLSKQDAGEEEVAAKEEEVEAKA